MFYCKILINIKPNYILILVDGSHIVFQIATLYIMALIDTERICLEHTLIVLRNTFNWNRGQNTYRQNCEFVESANSIIESLWGIDYINSSDNSCNSFNDFSFDDLWS